MNFELKEEHHLLQDLVVRFAREELLPLEPHVLARAAGTEGMMLTEGERTRLETVSREMGYAVSMPRPMLAASTCPSL